MEFEDIVLKELQKMPKGSKRLITKNKEKVIEAVKYLIDARFVVDIELTKDYNYIKRLNIF